MIQLENLSKCYGTSTVVDGVSLHVERNSITVIVGTSGSGKSTLLRMINRLVEPSSGRVLINGRDTRDEPAHLLRRRIGYAIQGHGLFPHRTVRENIATVPRLLGWEPARVRARVAELLEVFQLDPATYAEALPHQLSGGQQQRVGVARALAAEPAVLLMDEPYGALDPIIRAKAQEDLLAIQRRFGTTIVLVTHDMEEAFRLGDHVAVMSQGRLLQYDRPAVLLTRPADPFVSRMTGMADRAMRLLSLTTAAEAAAAGQLRGPVGGGVGDAARCALGARVERRGVGHRGGCRRHPARAAHGRRHSRPRKALTVRAANLLRIAALVLLVAFLATPQSFAPLFAPLTQYGAPPIYDQGNLMTLALAQLGTVCLAAAASTVVAVGLGIFVTRPAGAQFLPLSRTLVNVGQTFPPVAVLAVAVPLVGFGEKPTLIALFAYGLLPIFENTLVGLRTCPPAVLEAASGMGMSARQRLWSVELPLAMPLMLEGIRLSLVINVGTATIGSTVAAKGLGEVIIAGLLSSNTAFILQGGLVTGLMAILLYDAMVSLERRLLRRVTLD